VLKQDLFKLDKAQRWLRPEIVEMLLFVLWDELRRDREHPLERSELVLKYGWEEGFSEAYYDLMMEMECNHKEHEEHKE
jgi:hypothetical protein